MRKGRTWEKKRFEVPSGKNVFERQMVIYDKVILWMREGLAEADFEKVQKMRQDTESQFRKCSGRVLRVQPTVGQVCPTPCFITEPADSEFFTHTSKDA